MKIILKKHEVYDLLEEITEKLAKEGVNGLLLIKSRKNKKTNPEFTNEYCMNILECDDEDVMREIIDLKVSNYYESVFDKDSKEIDRLHIFIKEILNNQVYIKLKIKK